MRFHSIVLITSSFVFAGQVYVDKCFKVLDKSELDQSREAITQAIKIESEGFVKMRRDSGYPIMQSLATYTIHFAAICESKNRQDERGRNWEYYYREANCIPNTGNSRLLEISCYSWFNHRSGPTRWHLSADKKIPYECPDGTVCRRISWMNPTDGQTIYEVACVDEADVRTELVTPANSHADPNAPDVYCGLSLAIPGTEFTIKPGIHSIDITLTEEARFKDGSPYPAPMLYIRDKTGWLGFDRVFRRHASVASTQVTLRAVNGKFRTRIFDFCMQLSPGLTANAVIFTYSWFQTTRRHGRIPVQRTLNYESYNTTDIGCSANCLLSTTV